MTSVLQQICTAAAANFSVSPDAMRGSIRQRNAAFHARRIAIHLARITGAASLPELGQSFCIDHTTVLHHQRRAAELIEDGDQAMQIAVSGTLEILGELRRRHQAAAIASVSGEA